MAVDRLCGEVPPHSPGDVAAMSLSS